MGSAHERMYRGFGTGGNYTVSGNKTPENSSQKPAYLAPNSKAQTVDHKPSADFMPSDTSNLKIGQRVEHQKFGFGEVIKMEGSTHNPIATIKFELNGEKKIMLNYAKLRIVE